MNSKEIRLNNLKALIAKAGTAAEFSKQSDTATSLLSQILSPNPTRNIGDRLARKIEEKLNLPPGWMDSPHNVVIDRSYSEGEIKQAAPDKNADRFQTLLKIGGLIEDFTPAELAELQAQVELIRRRKIGGF